MDEVIRSVYYIVEDWIDQHDLMDEETRKLEARQDELQNEIIRRLGGDGQELMEALSMLNLKLETIHDQALFRAAMGLGARIARPGIEQADNARPYSTSR